MSIFETANLFFEACESGKGWQDCEKYCDPEASFSCQSDALADVSTLEDYCEWMKGLYGPIPDASYELKAMSLDESRRVVTAFAVFHGTNTGPGPVPPTNKKLAGDYVYAIFFESDRISHVTKIWNDAHSMKQLGWA